MTTHLFELTHLCLTPQNILFLQDLVNFAFFSFLFFFLKRDLDFRNSLNQDPFRDNNSKVRLYLNESKNDLSEGQIGFYLSRFIKCSFQVTTRSIALLKQRQGWGVASVTRANV